MTKLAFIKNLFFYFVLCLLVSCSGEPQEVRIGYLIDLEATDSNETIDAIKFAFEEKNRKAGGDQSKSSMSYRLLIRDCGREGSEAVDAARDLIFNENVHAIIGPNTSRAAIPVSLVAQKTETPMVTNGSTHLQTTLDKPYVFRTVITNIVQVKVLVRHLIVEEKLLKSAILYDAANVYSKNISSLFTQEYRRQGGEVVSTESYITGDINYEKQIKAIATLSPQVIFLPNFSRHVEKQLIQINQYISNTAIAGSDSWDFRNRYFQVPKKGVFLPVLTHPQYFDDSELSQKFVTEYKLRKGYPPGIGAALTYDTAQVVFRAIEQAEGLSGQAIRRSLSQIEFNGVTGQIRFDNQGNADRHIKILKQQNSELIILN